MLKQLVMLRYTALLYLLYFCFVPIFESFVTFSRSYSNRSRDKLIHSFIYDKLQFRVALLLWNMPGLPGLYFCLRSRPESPDIVSQSVSQ